MKNPTARLNCAALAALAADAFNLRAFHDRVLALGPLPPDVLEDGIVARVGARR